MEKNNEVIQTHPLVGWDISTVDSYDALMLRLHYQNPTQENSNDAEIGQTLWLTTDVARRTSHVSLFQSWKQALRRLNLANTRKTSTADINAACE
ncbi:biofilm formation regulatory protein BssS [Klebsiella pneumoniae]|nr:biofilm formation regulatory protein BssS [Klebsiella pneumoniae]STS03573.1 biofilm formation regulatory protein BssS [Klebsiella pneumoniae]VTN41292.1 biofilm formation regulatory protein BssS [Klebsiella pneumoniae]VTO01852.1 biofilm formation regulatory protein BssS [Klebsiella pneumoniae]